jgi:branched-chain amino acid transport system substrate-binding protein
MRGGGGRFDGGGDRQSLFRRCRLPDRSDLTKIDPEAQSMSANALRIVAAILLTTLPAWAQKSYDTGATDTEIKIGNIAPQTGWLSEYGATARAEAAYFQMINDRGGINGRKINFVTLDSQSITRNAIELTHRLVEQDQVLLIFGSQGLTANLTLRPYLNGLKIPQLFVASPVSKFNDPVNFPWTMGFQTSARTEAAIYAKYILQNRPEAKIGVLYADDEEGRDYLLGLHETLGEKAGSMIVKEVSYEDYDPYLDTQLAELKHSGADVFLNFTVGKYSTQAIRKSYDMDWHPLQFLPNASLSIAAFLDPAGLKRATGIITSARSKGWISVQYQAEPDVRAFLDWMSKYNPDARLRDAMNVYGYEAAEVMVEVLKNSGDNLTRANIMKQATSLDTTVGMLLPGIKITTSPTDYRPLKQLYLMRFDGNDWAKFTDIIGG